MAPQTHSEYVLFSPRPPKVCDRIKKLVLILNRGQKEDSVLKVVQDLRKLFDPIIENAEERRNFFDHTVFILQQCLVRGSVREKIDKFDEKLLNVVASMAASFKKERDEESEQDENALFEIPWFTRKLLIWLLDRHEVFSPCTRLRICLMINRILKELGDFEMDEDMYVKISKPMLERLKDKVSEIRAQAVTALSRLQNPEDQECLIIKAFLYHLQCDPSNLVRKTIIKNLGVTKYTLNDIVSKTRDVDDNVRLAAYKCIAIKTQMRSMKIAMRERVLKCGLNDQTKAVREYVGKELISTWLHQQKNNIVDFLYSLDVGSTDGKTAEACLKAHFKHTRMSEIVESFDLVDSKEKVIPLEKLSPESVVYWKNLVEYLCEKADSEEAEAHLEKVRPELTEFCRYIRHFFESFCEKVNNDGPKTDEMLELEVKMLFVGKNLIEMTNLYDFLDESGRRTLVRLVLNLLSSRSLNLAFLEPLMKVYGNAENRPLKRIQKIAEIIAELRDPLINTQRDINFLPTQPEIPNDNTLSEKQKENELCELRFKLQKMRFEQNIIKDEMDKASYEMNFTLASDLKLKLDKINKEMVELNKEILNRTSAKVPEPPQEIAPEPDVPQTQTQKSEDPIIILKCLTIISELLRAVDIKKLTPTLQTLLDEFVYPSVASPLHVIRKTAVIALGSLCLRCPVATNQYAIVLLKAAQMDEAEVRVHAIQELVNILMYLGATPFEDEEENPIDHFFNDQKGPNETIGSFRSSIIVRVICEQLNSPDTEVQTVVVEGLCKLLMSGQITAPKLLSRFIILFYNPVNEDNVKLCHILALFLRLYPSLSSRNQMYFADSMVETLKTLSDPPKHSPLLLTEIDRVGKLYIELTREDSLQDIKKSTENCHDRLAFTFLNECITKPENVLVKYYCKFLLDLQITKTDFKVLTEINILNNQLMEKVVDKSVLKFLEKMEEKLGFMIKAISNQDEGSDQSQAVVEVSLEAAEPPPPQPQRRALFSRKTEKYLVELNATSQNEEPENILTSTQASDRELVSASSQSSDMPSPIAHLSSINAKPTRDSGLRIIPESDSESSISSLPSVEGIAMLPPSITIIPESDLESSEATTSRRSSRRGSMVSTSDSSVSSKATTKIGPKSTQKGVAKPTPASVSGRPKRQLIQSSLSSTSSSQSQKTQSKSLQVSLNSDSDFEDPKPTRSTRQGRTSRSSRSRLQIDESILTSTSSSSPKPSPSKRARKK